MFKFEIRKSSEWLPGGAKNDGKYPRVTSTSRGECTALGVVAFGGQRWFLCRLYADINWLPRNELSTVALRMKGRAGRKGSEDSVTTNK